MHLDPPPASRGLSLPWTCPSPRRHPLTPVAAVARLGAGQDLPAMPVGIPEIQAAAPEAVIDLHVVARVRAAAIGHAARLQAAEDGVEILLADVKREVVTLELLPLVEVERQRLVDRYLGEVSAHPRIRQPHDL